MQATVGMVRTMAEIGRRAIRDHLIDQHRLFYEQLPFAVFGVVDPDGLVWATPRAGRPGFLKAASPFLLRATIAADEQDPASRGVFPGAPIALIGIEPATRRRNRLNGRVASADAQALEIAVEESFGNCPQYIPRREPGFTRNPACPAPYPPTMLTRCDDEARAMIEGADSFFVASFAKTPHGRRVDVSHRGGALGFVRIDKGGILTIPDFRGNNFFNTLGNIRETGKAGLVFIDWISGDVLQLSGDARIILDPPEIAALGGAERLWRVRPRRIARRRSALPLTWRPRPSPAE